MRLARVARRLVEPMFFGEPPKNHTRDGYALRDAKREFIRPNSNPL